MLWGHYTQLYITSREKAIPNLMQLISVLLHYSVQGAMVLWYNAMPRTLNHPVLIYHFSMRLGELSNLTLPETILLVLVLLGIMGLLIPKLGKRARKARRALPRKGPFRVKDNPFKTYRAPNPDIVAIAQARRQERLQNATVAEDRFQEILQSMGFLEWQDYERESVMFYPGSFCLFDYFFKKSKIVFELDGSAHDDRGQHAHDEGRDLYFARQGIRTVRIRNKIVMGNDKLCRTIIAAELGMVI